MGNRYAILAPAVDTNGDGVVSAAELATAAFKGGLFVTLGLLSSVGLATGIVWGGPGALRLMLLALSAGMLAGSAIGAWRLLYAIYEIPHRWAAADRRRAIEAEDYERDYREGLTAEVKDRITQAEVDSAVDILLALYYAGKPWQRGKVKGISDVKWNIANDTLKKCKLRMGRADRLEAETYDEAWSKYLRWRRANRTFRVGDDGDLVAS